MPTGLNSLLDLLDAGEWLIAPSASSARALRESFDSRQRDREVTAWHPAQVLSWQQFTAGLWSSLVLNGSESRLLLNSAQEHELWLEVLSSAAASDPSPAGLSSPNTLAELAASAFKLAAAHGALPRLARAATSQDTRTFATWVDLFQRRLQARDCLTAAQLDAALTAHVQDGTLLCGSDVLPAALHLVALDDPSASQSQLLIALRSAGTDLHEHTLLATQTAVPTHLLATDPHAELELAAGVLVDLFSSPTPPTRVTVLLPDPAADRAEFESLLRTALAPELNDVASDLSSQPWEFATAAPLTGQALINDALELLRLATGPLPLARVTPLLRSPFLGQPAHRDASARFDAWLRSHYRSLRPELDLATLNDHLETYRDRVADKVPGLSARLPLWPAHLKAQLQRTPLEPAQPRTYGEWSEALRLLLRAAEFPPGEGLTATTFALTRSWDALLDTIATLDFAGSRVPLAAVLDRLDRLAQTTPCMPPATHGRIQVMSYGEAGATLHDHVLLLRATDANLPARERPHPLLPWSLQRELGMPGTDPVADSARGQKRFLDLLAASANIIITSAADDAEGKLRPSPLIAASGITTHATAVSRSPLTLIQLERILDDDPLPASPTEVPGGSRLLTLQAACGFRAFAELRLFATEPDDPTLGLNPRDSGSLLHRTLHHFWSMITSQDELKATSEPERIRLLDHAIEAALADRHIPERSAWDAAYTRLVTQRLRHLLLQWLREEELRGPFRIARLETDEQITVGPLTLNVRVDRIDAVSGTDGNGVLFVDYKTGADAKPKQWESPRPEEPQLPLYALLSLADPEQVRGLAFARIRAGDMRWHGIHAEDGILPKSPVREIPELIAEWHLTLTALAHDFHLGDVRVNPANYPQTCQHCGQRLLCRLDPATLMQLDDFEDMSECSAEGG